MKRTHRANDISESAPSTPEAPPPADAPSVRGRPGRRSVEERRHAVLELISGKAGVDQLAQRFGVLPSTIEAWRDEALEGITEALRRGTAKSPRETDLERENADLREALIESTMKVTLLQRAAGIHGARPTRPARSRR